MRGNYLLWTGGWDSTFRLLRAIVIEEIEVTPVYILDENRRSVLAELRAMRAVKEKLAEVIPGSKERIAATVYYALSDIPADPGVVAAFKRIRERFYIGTQYEWLARFCELTKISPLELCIHRDDKAYVVVSRMLKEEFNSTANAAEREDLSRLFGHFNYPILDLTKLEMQSEVESNGWGDIMRLTWFCHSPIGGKPCGICNPCIYTVEEGLGWRLPMSRRLVSKGARLIKKIV